MKSYIIYKSGNGKLIAVKNGFSWPAFFFAPFWAFIKGLYGLGVGLVFLIVLVQIGVGSILANSIIGPIAVGLTSLFIALVMGAEGNGFWRERLQKRSFVSVREGQWPSADSALNTFRNDQPSQQKAPYGF